ncbi:unnamed protein product [Amoebophrya sp. A25]|nr:unnamed protein product [Amoebophrya sp. A25]|eukprot:GSA25T00003636001.1
MKITLDLVERSDQSVNPAKERQLTLRGNHVEVIENLGITKDQYECFDFSDNNLIKIHPFPALKRVRTLLFANNSIQRIAPEAFVRLPNLEAIVLTKNKIRDLVDLEPLAKCKKLQRLTLRENEICAGEYYRQFVIYLMRDTPLKILDFQKITQTEREEARQLFEEKDRHLFDRLAPTRLTREEEVNQRREMLSASQKLVYKKLLMSTTDAMELQILQEKFDRGEAPPDTLAELKVEVVS